MSRLSLRSRLLLGAVLWTAGLFAVTGLVTTAILLNVPHAPRIFHGLFEHALLPSLVALASMAVGLWHVRRGVRPLGDLRERLNEVRAGRARRVGGEYPAEVQPLVDDLNALLDEQHRAVARAQAKAGDLAHGLKTPLALLLNDADRAERAGHLELAAAMRQHGDRMRRQLDYHLAHARAAASGTRADARCRVAESADGIARVLERLYAERGPRIDVDVAAGVEVRLQREDLEEILGNLLDNGCKWARARVLLRTAPSAPDHVGLIVDDDGPGLARDKWQAVLQRGVRADEAAPGSGFGLAIARDLVEVYGGTLELDDSPLGGLRVRLQLPRAG